MKNAIRGLAVVVSVLLLAGAAAAPAPAIVVPPLRYTERTLANGLKLYALPDPTSSSATVHVWYGVGAKDDPKGRAGFAHLFEHMMFRDTKNLASEQARDLTTGGGGEHNGSTLFDFTIYSSTAPAGFLKTLLWYEGERMANLVVDDAAFNAERHIVEEELRQRIFAPPYGRILYILMPKFTYTTELYKRPFGGTFENLDAATVDDARAFHETYYRPDNATVVVSGNFNPKELDAWADKYLGHIAHPQAPIPRTAITHAPRTVPLQVTTYAPNVPAPAIVHAWVAPRVADPDTAVMLLIEAILGHGKSSRLYNVLVGEKQVATRVYVSNLLAKDGGVFAPTVILAPGKTVAEGDAALSAVMDDLRNTPIGDAELTTAKNELLADSLAMRETTSGRALLLGQGLALTGDPGWADRSLKQIQAVTPADVQRVARKYLSANGVVDIHYLDESARATGAPETPMPSTDDIGTTIPPAKIAPVALLPADRRAKPPAPEPPKAPTLPEVSMRTLPNGLRVEVARSTEVPIVQLALSVQGGNAADPSAKAGLAQITANLLLRGSETRSASDIDRRVEALGGKLDAGVAPDGAALVLSAPAANIDAAGAMLADTVLHPAFAPSEFAREQGQQIARWRETMGQPREAALQFVPALEFGASPYGQLVTEATLQAITRDDVLGEHRTLWRPDNATLVITGSLSAEQGFALAERLFGGWARPDAPLPPVSGAAGAAGHRIVVLDMPGAGQAMVTAAMRAIPRGGDDYAPLTIGNLLLNKVIVTEVRLNRGLSYSVDATLDARRAAGMLYVAASTKNETVAEVCDLILEGMARAGSTPPDADELRKRAVFLAFYTGRQVETADGLSKALVELSQDGVPAAALGRYLSGVLAATPEQVQAAERSRLDTGAISVLIVGDASKFIDALRQKHPAVEVIPLKDVDPGKLRSPAEGR